MISMDGATFSAEQQAIVNCADFREKDSLAAHCAHELSLRVQNQHFAVGAKYQEETRQFRDHALSDFLLNVDTLLQLKGSQ